MDTKLRFKNAIKNFFEENIISLAIISVIVTILSSITNLYTINNTWINSFLSFIIGLLLFLISAIISLTIYNAAKNENKLSLKDILEINISNLLPLLFKIFIYTFLWTLLFIIPGIIKSLEYQRAIYLKFDKPELSDKEALHLAKQQMNGYKVYLFLETFKPIIILLGFMIFAGLFAWLLKSFILLLVLTIVLILGFMPYMLIIEPIFNYVLNFTYIEKNIDKKIIETVKETEILKNLQNDVIDITKQ